MTPPSRDIRRALEEGRGRLAGLPDARREAEWLLMDVLSCSRARLFSHADQMLDDRCWQQFLDRLERRAQGEPLAYVLGHCVFRDLTLTVSTDVLIPRPETEWLVEEVLRELPADESLQVVDLGTGSGAIAMALARERSRWRLSATDLSAAALRVARGNAATLGLESVRFLQGSWFEALEAGQCFDAVVSNPPYVAPGAPALDEAVARHEPELALYAGQRGMAVLRQLIEEATGWLRRGGLLALEHMHDEQLLRYSRQIMLPFLDVAGQQRLLDATVLIVGAGGLGSPAALYLAAAGVGRLLLADHDHVELSNLQRQILHGQNDIGRPKVESGRDRLLQLDPDLTVETLQTSLDDTTLDALLSRGGAPGGAEARIDVVVDGSDNFATRFAVNRACVRHAVPLVSGAAIRMEGQVAVFDPTTGDSPCYRCLYSGGDDRDASCARNGVMAPLVGIIGAVQAMEVVKLLAAVGEPLTGRLLLLDAMTLQWRELRLRRDPDCPVCAGS